MIYVIIAALIVAADGLVKGWITQNLALGAELPLLPGVLGLTNLHNYGAAFSLFRSLQAPILVLTAFFVAAVVWALLTGWLENKAYRLCAAMVLGGAVGNAIDRLTLGYVVDMFQTQFVDFAIFNVADCFITVGGILFCLCLLTSGAKSEKQKGKARRARMDAAMSELEHKDEDDAPED